MMNRTLLKNIAIITATIIVAISLITLSGYLMVQIFWAEPTIMQTVVSPDGKYTAYVFESNGGATTGWIYHVSVLPSDKTLGKGNGNVYINGSIPPNSIVWLSNDELYVDDYKSINTTKQKQSINGVRIRYHSLED